MKTTSDIRKQYTAKVSEYLAKGYEICIETMSGTQGEMAKVDFVKDNEIIEVRLDEVHRYREHDRIVITVEKYERPERLESRWTTLWIGKGETIEEISFYKVDEKGKYFTSSLEEIEEIKNKKYARWEMRYSRDRKELAFNPETIVRIARNHAGFKRTKADDIYKVTKDTSAYRIFLNNGKSLEIER